MNCSVNICITNLDLTTLHYWSLVLIVSIPAHCIHITPHLKFDDLYILVNSMPKYKIESEGHTVIKQSY